MKPAAAAPAAAVDAGAYWTRLQLERSASVYRTEVPRRFLREHVRFVEALDRGVATLAEERMASHIEHGRAAFKRSLGA